MNAMHLPSEKGWASVRVQGTEVEFWSGEFFTFANSFGS